MLLVVQAAAPRGRTHPPLATRQWIPARTGPRGPFRGRLSRARGEIAQTRGVRPRAFVLLLVARRLQVATGCVRAQVDSSRQRLSGRV